MIVVPSILSDSLDLIQSEVLKVATETSLRTVQIDIIDPDFAEEVTIHPIDLLDLDLQKLEIDIHLMTNDPINDVIECSQIPGIHSIIAQIERMPSQRAYVEHVKSLQMKAGLSIDLYTPVDEVDSNVIPTVEYIQVMGNKAGRQGQPFIGQVVLEKINELSIIRSEKKYKFQIIVDIGMTPENAKACGKAGADIVTPGSFLWNATSLHDAIEAYR